MNEAKRSEFVYYLFIFNGAANEGETKERSWPRYLLHYYYST